MIFAIVVDIIVDIAFDFAFAIDASILAFLAAAWIISCSLLCFYHHGVHEGFWFNSIVADQHPAPPPLATSLRKLVIGSCALVVVGLRVVAAPARIE